MLEWERWDDRPANVLEHCEMDGRVAREMRRAEIVMELNLLRVACNARHVTEEVVVSNCGVKGFLGEDICRLSILGFVDDRGA
jgi:hypothetical protein